MVTPSQSVRNVAQLTVVFKELGECIISFSQQCILALHDYGEKLVSIQPRLDVRPAAPRLPLGSLFSFSEEVINRIIALTKAQGDAIDDKVGVHH